MRGALTSRPEPDPELGENKQVKPIGFEAPQGGAYNNRKHLKLETPCS